MGAEHDSTRLREQVYQYMSQGVTPVVAGMKRVLSNFATVMQRGDVAEMEKRGRKANRESAYEEYGVAAAPSPVFL